MYKREQDAIRRVLDLISKSRPTWRSHGVCVGLFDEIARQLDVAWHERECEAIRQAVSRRRHPTNEAPPRTEEARATLTRIYTRIGSLLRAEIDPSRLSHETQLDLRALSAELLALQEERALSAPDPWSMQRDSRQFVKTECERCGATGTDHELIVHHVDLDRRNNIPDNIKTLCKTCHPKEHEPTGGYSAFTRTVLPARSGAQLREAADWIAERILGRLEELRTWVPGRREPPRLLFHGKIFNQAKRNFGISIWQNSELDSLVKKTLRKAGFNSERALLRETAKLRGSYKRAKKAAP